MSTVSGLSDAHREQVRKTIVKGCELLIANKTVVHYTQGPDRWEYIHHRLRAAHGQYPRHGDCSSTATGLLWDALTSIDPRFPDIVNHANWTGGFTGTIAAHGRIVEHDMNIKIGDLILYGRAPTYEHVVVALGGHKAFSHGGEAGPFIVDLDYRPDRGPTRRFI